MREEGNEAMKERHNPLAYVLWVVVGVGILYGVTQVALKGADLFTETAEPQPCVTMAVEP